MGVPSASFVETYSAKVTELMIHLVEYIQYLDNIKTPPIPPDPSPGTNPSLISGSGSGRIPVAFSTANSTPLDKNENGFPILPDPIPGDKWKKVDWDKLFTDFLGQQYYLATGGKTKHIPYKLIQENQRSFIDSKYLPGKMVFRPPRNIVFDDMKMIFDHLLQRQREHGPEDTFRFKSIKWKGKKEHPQYQKIDNNNSDSERPGPRTQGSQTVPDHTDPDVVPRSLRQNERESGIPGSLTQNEGMPRERPNNRSENQESVIPGSLTQNEGMPRDRPTTRSSNRGSQSGIPGSQTDPATTPGSHTQNEGMPRERPTTRSSNRGSQNVIEVGETPQVNAKPRPRPRPITRGNKK